MRRRSNLLLYLLLNIIVSAATTLAVLAIWDALNPATLARPVALPPLRAEQQAPPLVITSTEPSPTLPPPGEKVIEIISVVAAGDLDQEQVMLRRAGEGNLLMTGWKLVGERGNAFVFPAQPELILYQGGALEIFSHTGDNTPTEVYLDREEAAWQMGETIRLLDTAGNERALYKIP
jgi:hypothetical protein